MRATGYLMVMVVFVAVALLSYGFIRAAGWDANDFALIAAAIVASYLGALIWHRQSPATSERSVKLGLGIVISITAVVFAMIFQAVAGWLTHPDVVIPIAAIGCFIFPFAVTGPVWRALCKQKSRGSMGSRGQCCDDRKQAMKSADETLDLLDFLIDAYVRGGSNDGTPESTESVLRSLDYVREAILTDSSVRDGRLPVYSGYLFQNGCGSLSFCASRRYLARGSDLSAEQLLTELRAFWLRYYDFPRRPSRPLRSRSSD